MLPSGENIRKHVTPMVNSWEQTVDEVRRKNSHDITNLPQQTKPKPAPRKLRFHAHVGPEQNDASSGGSAAGDENMEHTLSVGSRTSLPERICAGSGSPLGLLSPTVTDEFGSLAAGHRGTTLLQHFNKRATKPTKKQALEQGLTNRFRFGTVYPGPLRRSAQGCARLVDRDDSGIFDQCCFLGADVSRRRRKKIVEKFDPDIAQKEQAAHEVLHLSPGLSPVSPDS